MGKPVDKFVTNEPPKAEIGSDKPARRYSPHLNPIHVTTAPSLLSRRMRASFTLSGWEAQAQQQEIQGHEKQPLDITGFKHLLMLLLVTGNIKMIWNDSYQFGFWNTLKYFGLDTKDLKFALLIFGSNILFMPLALAIECISAKSFNKVSGSSVSANSDAKDEQPGSEDSTELHSSGDVKSSNIPSGSFFTPSAILHLLCCVACLASGSLLTWNYVHHPLIATACESNVIVTFLKLTSFALTNHELRNASLYKGPIPSFYKSGPEYPNNLSLSNLIYFWAVPTLIYQPVYPKRPSVRWSRIMPIIGEIITGLILIWALMMQVALPVLEHMVDNFSSLRSCFEDYMTFAPISVIIWLVGFVIVFQSTLNLAAEITRFADRNFYGDWWNAGNVGTFWREWNRPVSNYFRRHLYTPMRTAGLSRMAASNAVFFISALFHELLFGVAAHTFNGVAFICLIIQPVLILATEPLEKLRGKGTTIGNCVFWLSILFGQPTAIVIYFLEWVARNPDSKVVGK